jgi:hypothetical protein
MQLLKGAFEDVLEAGLIGVTVFRAKQRRPAFRFSNLPQNKNTNCYFVGKMLLLATYVETLHILRTNKTIFFIQLNGLV